MLRFDSFCQDKLLSTHYMPFYDLTSWIVLIKPISSGPDRLEFSESKIATMNFIIEITIQFAQVLRSVQLFRELVTALVWVWLRFRGRTRLSAILRIFSSSNFIATSILWRHGTPKYSCKRSNNTLVIIIRILRLSKIVWP